MERAPNARQGHNKLQIRIEGQKAGHSEQIRTNGNPKHVWQHRRTHWQSIARHGGVNLGTYYRAQSVFITILPAKIKCAPG